MPSDLFMNYLFGTAPLCSVHFFFLSSLESCRSVIADATLCHPEFGLTSCEPSGRSISILACSRVCWRWEWLIKQVWASTPILLHAKQELSGLCREESWWQYSKHITINLCTEPGPSHKDNELLFPPLFSHLCSSEEEFPVFITHWKVVGPLTFFIWFQRYSGNELFSICSWLRKRSIGKRSGFTIEVLCVCNLKAFV